MRSIRLILSVVILSMLFASALLAQEALTETFTSEDGSLIFNYPSGWIVDYEETQIIGGNSQAAIAAVLNREPAARDHVVFAFFNPISAADLGVSADASVAEALAALGIDSGEASIEERTVGGVELAFTTHEPDDNQPNIAAVRALDGGLFLFIVARTTPDSVETYLPTLLEILASAVYTPPPPGGGAVLELPAGTIPDPASGAGDVIWEVNMDGRQIYIQNLAVDTQGTIYVAIEPYPFTDSSGDDGLRGVLVFNADGTFQRAFYNAETDLRLTGMTVGADGSIWFSKFGYGSGARSQLIRLDADGNFVSQFVAGIGFLGEGEFVVVSGSDGNLYSQVSDEPVRVFAPDGTFVREFDARGQLSAASLDGALYFVEYGDTRAVHATDLEGNPLVSIPFGEGVFIAAVAAGDGVFYLADNNRLLRQYDSAGTLTGSYELANLAGNMAALPDGDVIVTYRNTLARVRVSGMAVAAPPTAAPVVSQPLGPAAPQPTATPRPTLAPPPTPIPTQAAAGASLRIEYGETVSGNLARNSVDRWTFVGNAGDQVTISMTSPNFDTYLELLGPDGSRIASNDDGGEGLNSLISGFSLPANGTYTVVARGFSTSASGAYELTLALGTITSSAAPAATAIPTTAPNTTATPRSGGRTVIESGAIEYGETISGRLGRAEAHHYSLRGNAGDVISISMTSPDFDTYLEILSSDGARIAYNDDGGLGLNSLINGFTLPASGTYTIVAFAFRDTTSGPYELSIVLGTITLPTATPPPTSTPQPSVSMGSIEYGQTVQATLARGSRDEYMLRGNAGDVISISMTSAAFDTYLEIFSSDGTRIAYNDDGGEGLNSLISGFSLPANGTYTIVARGFSSTVGGDYELALVLGTITLPTATPPPTSTPRPSVSMGSIEYGQTVQATLARGSRDEYTLRGNGGDVITVSLTSAAFDTYLEIFSADGTRIAYNDDGGEGLNSLISAFRLPADGTYTIVARGFSSTAGGDYVLSLTFIEVTSSNSLVYGDSVQGALASGGRDRWTFEGRAGDRVTISMTSPDFDTYLELLGPTGTQLVTNDDGGEGLNSLINNFSLPSAGTYTIIARGFTSSASGAYSLTLTAPGASSSGTGTSGTSSGGTVRQWAARAEATSQYGNPSWGAIQATGAPDTARCGDLTTAWASRTSRGRDSLTVYFDQAVIPTQINIYQTYNPGSIISVDLIQANGTVVRVPNSADPGTPCPGIFTLNITQANLRPVNGVIINLDQTIGGSWNEIDAVELVGTP